MGGKSYFGGDSSQGRNGHIIVLNLWILIVSAFAFTLPFVFCKIKRRWKELVIFDLDGTLLNTIADLAISTNYALHRCGFPKHREEEYFHFVGNGITKLFERALPEECRSSDNVSRVRRYFLEYYSVHNTDYTRPYDKVEELLSVLNSHGVKIAVASNKYQAGTQKLIQYFFPGIDFVSVLGQRDGIPVKSQLPILYMKF